MKNNAISIRVMALQLGISILHLRIGIYIWMHNDRNGNQEPSGKGVKLRLKSIANLGSDQ
jgi:hypothetical protein